MARDEIEGRPAPDHVRGTSLTDDDREARQAEAFLLAFDEGLANGSTADDFDLTSVPPELATELRGAQDCLWLLHAASRAGQLDDLATGTTTRQSARPAMLESIERIGRFTIVRELGRGGHGIVFLAIDPNLGRRVALKVPRPEALIAPDLRRRFLLEAEAAGSLRHGNLVTVFEAGEDGPLCFLAMEYCDGPTLAQWLKEDCEAVSPRLAAEFVAMLATGVEHAHSLGVLHRDIKPSNVLLEPLAKVKSDNAVAAPLLSAFTPKLTDFGLAKLIERQDDETRGGTLLGTPAYMAPEQAAGRTREVGVATDVYGLGVLLYEVLTGRAPFRGENDPDTLRQVCLEEPIAPGRLRPRLPRDLQAICLKCLEKKPANRYKSAGELASDLQCFLAGEPTLARPATPWQRVLKWSRRRPAIAALIGVIVAAVSLVSMGGWVSTVRTQAALDLAEERRVEAEASELKTRRVLYASELSRAMVAWESNDPQLARQLVDAQIPRGGHEDLREFGWRHMHYTANEEEHVLHGHTADVFRVSFSPDGRKLASASKDHDVRLWDVASGKLIGVLQGHTDEVLCIAFSFDSRRLASVGEDGKVLLWDVNALKLDRELFQDEQDLHCVSFSPDGGLLVTAGASQQVLVWNTSNWERMPNLVGHCGIIEDLEFSPDGVRLATACDDGTIWIWDVLRAQPLAKLIGHGSENVRGVSYLPNGKRLVSVGRNHGTARVWDLESLSNDRFVIIEQSKVFLEHTAWLLATAAGRDNCSAFVSARDGVVQLIDLETQEVRITLGGHEGRVWGVSISPDGKRVATCGADKTIRVWPLAAFAHRRARLPGEIGAIYFPADGLPLAIQSSPRPGHLIDFEPSTSDERRSRMIELLDEGGGFDQTKRSIALSQPARVLAVAFPKSHRVRLQSLVDGHELATIQVGDVEIDGIDLAPDAGKLAVVSSTGETRVWDVASQTIIASLPAEGFFRRLVRFSPKGDMLAFAYDPLDRIAVWDFTRDAAVNVFQQSKEEDSVALAFAPDGKLLATSGDDRLVKFWDVASGKQAFSLSGHQARIIAIAFSADGRTLATGSEDCSIKLWDLSTRLQLLTLHGHKSAVVGLFFRPDNQQLVSIGRIDRDYSGIHFWETQRNCE